MDETDLRRARRDASGCCRTCSPTRRSSAPTRATSSTARTPSSASTTCATTWPRTSSEKVQRGHSFAIVDEVDNILIDEARTPLIISGAPEQAADLYVKFARLAPTDDARARRPKAWTRARRRSSSRTSTSRSTRSTRRVSITEQGVAKAERFLGIDHLYRAENGHLVNHLIQALRAESLYKRDVDYAVIDGEVKIIDEFTGRILDGRRWSEGLHQAIEAKEGVSVQEENQTLATITYQNYFRLYDKLAGMTGTALTEATEFMKIYELPVVQVPTNMPMVREDRNDQVYKTKEGKWNAVVNEIAARHENGQPVLVGTISVEVSELLVRAAEEARDQAHGAERQARARRARGRDRRRGGPARRGDDRDEHGRPRRGHQARRQPRAPRPPGAREGGDRARATRSYERRMRELLPEIERAWSRRPRARDGGRRPVHLRHRAPRVAAHRQPAARALRAPGRPGRVALLPVGRGRSRAAVRGRPHLPDPRQTRRRRRGGQRGTDRGGDAVEADRESPEEGRGAELPDHANACSSTTT